MASRRTAALAAAALVAGARAQLGLRVSADGAYAVTYDGADVPQLSSAAGAYVARWGGVVHSSANKTLVLDAPPAPIEGDDVLGHFVGHALSFNGGLFGAAFRSYAARGAIVFAQSFPKGLTGMSGGDKGGLATAFPVFGPARGDLHDAATGFVTWRCVHSVPRSTRSRKRGPRPRP